MTRESTPRIRCRQISDFDIPAVVQLLAKGFPHRSPAYWARAMQRLAQRDAPAPYPRFGYLLEFEGAAVGVIVLIFSARSMNNETHIKCNISSWYVEPTHRGYASFLIAAALRHKGVTYVNISPAVHTWPTIEAQGFVRYSFGQIIAFPALGARVANTCVRPFEPGYPYGPSLAGEERDILTAHLDYGCHTYIVTENGRANPFIFQARRILRRRIPILQLIYCRDVRDFARLAGPIGRELMKSGVLIVALDAVGPLPGLVGKYFPDRGGRRYFKGPDHPHIGDLTFSEMVLFGL